MNVETTSKSEHGSHQHHHHHIEVDPRVHLMERIISHTLRIGVLLSLLVVVIGIVVTFARHTDYFTSPQQMHRLGGEQAIFPSTLGQVAGGVAQGQGRAIVVLGLLLLILTPVMRVAISIFTFAFERDRAFVVLTSIVLILLLVSFFLGKVG